MNCDKAREVLTQKVITHEEMQNALSILATCHCSECEKRRSATVGKPEWRSTYSPEEVRAFINELCQSLDLKKLSRLVHVLQNPSLTQLLRDKVNETISALADTGSGDWV
jgi:hypothetical protein